MNEKFYGFVSNAAVWSLVMGIVTIVTGVATGVLLLVTSARLFKSRDDGLY